MVGNVKETRVELKQKRMEPAPGWVQTHRKQDSKDSTSSVETNQSDTSHTEHLMGSFTNILALEKDRGVLGYLEWLEWKLNSFVSTFADKDFFLFRHRCFIGSDQEISDRRYKHLFVRCVNSIDIYSAAFSAVVCLVIKE